MRDVIALDVTVVDPSDRDRVVKITTDAIFAHFPVHQMHGSIVGRDVRMQIVLACVQNADLIRHVETAVAATLEQEGIWVRRCKADGATKVTRRPRSSDGGTGRVVNA